MFPLAPRERRLPRNKSLSAPFAVRKTGITSLSCSRSPALLGWAIGALIAGPAAALPALPPLPLSATVNQLSAANGLNAALQNASAAAPAQFALLPALPVAALPATLDQLAGGVGADLGAVADQADAPLLDTLMQRLGNGGGVIAVPGSEGQSPALPPILAPWVSAIGGHSNLSGDAASGAQNLSAGVAGAALGLESRIGDSAILGASVAIAHESASAGTGGKSRSNDVTLALYGRAALFGQGYAAGALAYGWHDVRTLRIVTVSGTDDLAGKFTGHDVSGRAELGWRFVMPDRAVLAPFLAFGGDSFSAPAYGETAAAGEPTFALAFAPGTITNEHVEAGLHLARDFGGGGEVVSLGADAAWAHQLSGPPVVEASFAALAGSNFLVRGLRPALDSALLGAGLQLGGGDGLSYGVRADGQFGAGLTAYSGTVNLVYRF